MFKRSIITVVSALVSALLALGWLGSADAQSGRRLLLMSGGPKLWTPINLGSALVAWWDASYLPSLTFNGSNISAWADRVSGIVASQGTGAKQPAWNAAALNGNPGITFAGATSQILLFSNSGTPLPSGTSASTMAISVNSTDTTNLYFNYGTATAGEARAIGIVSGTIEVWWVNADLNGSGSPTGTSFLMNTWSSGSSPSLINYLNGTSVNTGSASGINTILSANGAIGAPWSSGIFGATRNSNTIQQIVITNTVVTTCQRQKLEGSVGSWYIGLAGANLPSNHPYKKSAPLVGGSC